MALTADRNVRHQGEGILTGYPVEDAVLIYKGAIVMVNAAGYAAPATDTAGCRVVGICDEQADNTITGHTQGGIKVRVRSGAIFTLPATSITQAMLNDELEAVDDATVDETTTNANVVGKLVRYDSATQGGVFIPPTGNAI